MNEKLMEWGRQKEAACYSAGNVDVPFIMIDT